MSEQITHVDPEETIRKLKAKVTRLEKALAEQPAPVQQEPVVRIAELEETVRHLNHALREATEAPTFMGEPVIAEPVASINGVDEYGPMLDWYPHWVNFPVGTKLYTSPPEQRTVLPDAITDDSESPEYRAGWNECREVMMAGAQRKPLTDDEIDLIGFRAVGKVDCPTLSGLVPYGEEIQPVVREIARAIEAAHGITNE